MCEQLSGLPGPRASGTYFAPRGSSAPGVETPALGMLLQPAVCSALTSTEPRPLGDQRASAVRHPLRSINR